jgi:hypothetical protein
MTVNGNLTITAGKTLEFQGDGQLTVTGNWHDQGTFIPGMGTVIFTGDVGADLDVASIRSDVISDYAWSTFPVGLTVLSNPSVGNSGTNTSTDVSIGFNFNYMGTTYNQVRLTTNG